MSLGPIVWLYIAEILPPSGQTITTLVNWLFVTVIGLGFPILQEQIHIEGCFAIFMLCCIAGLIIIVIWCKETRDKTFEEIEAMFENTGVIRYTDDLLLSHNDLENIG